MAVWRTKTKTKKIGRQIGKTPRRREEKGERTRKEVHCKTKKTSKRKNKVVKRRTRKHEETKRRGHMTNKNKKIKEYHQRIRRRQIQKKKTIICSSQFWRPTILHNWTSIFIESTSSSSPSSASQSFAHLNFPL